MSGKRNRGKIVFLLFVCFLFLMPLAFAGTPEMNKTTKTTQDSVVFTHIPANGLYFRYRFAAFPAPFFIWFRAPYLTEIGCYINGSNISKVELWFPDIGNVTETEPPFSWVFVPGPVLPRFGHTKPWISKVYMNDGRIFWDNLTVYRLF